MLRPDELARLAPRAALAGDAAAAEAPPKGEHPRVCRFATVAPEPGLMLLWPAWLHHAVLPAAAARGGGTTPRVSVAFNVNLADPGGSSGP